MGEEGRGCRQKLHNLYIDQSIRFCHSWILCKPTNLPE